MSETFGDDEKRLVLQFLGVLHTWIQDQRVQKEQDIATLQIQESLVKLLFARVSKPEFYKDPQFTEAGKIIFTAESDDEDWYDVFAREKDTLSDVGVELTEKDVVDDGAVIDFFTRQRVTKESEDEE